MPGFALIHDLAQPLDRFKAAFDLALSLAAHSETYSHHSLAVGTHCLLGWSAYPEYPIRVIESECAVLLLDGVIYEPSAAALFDQAKSVDSDPDRCRLMAAWLRKWLPEADAECVIVYADRRPTAGLVIANDSLGRLPTYHAFEGRRMLVAREPKLMTPFLRQTEADQQGIAESLHFGFPLGNRTLLKSIARLGAGSIFEVGPGGPPTCSTYHTWSLDTIKTAARPTSADAMTLSESFVGACRTHAGPQSVRKNVLFLSGGMDSRAVAGGLVKSGQRFESLTTTHALEGKGDSECVYAAKVADLLRFPHRIQRLTPPRAVDYQWIIELRDGLNFAAMAETRQLYQAVRNRWGNAAVVWTGDGGDKVMPCLRPRHTIRSISSLTAMVSAGALMLERPLSCRIAGLSTSEFLRRIAETLDQYPERELADRYVHFNIFERGFKWLFEGEERTRSLLWATTPFYSQRFFQEAMSVPQSWKESRRWYCEFLEALHPGLTKIPDANTGKEPGSSADTRREWAKQMVRRVPNFEQLIRSWRRHRASQAERALWWLPAALTNSDPSISLPNGMSAADSTAAFENTKDAVQHCQLVTVLWHLHQLASTRWYWTQIVR